LIRPFVREDDQDAPSLAPAARSTRRGPSRLERIGASCLIVVLLGLEVWAVAGYHDDWPFAVNAMFSFHRTPSEPVYDVFVTASGLGASRRLDPRTDLGAPNTESFRRMFFARWYGSTSSRFPQRGVVHDDPARFIDRMDAFCKAVTAELARRGEAVPATVSVEIDRLQREGRWWVVTERRTAFVYDVATGSPEVRARAA
jgi:hypothetical protein